MKTNLSIIALSLLFFIPSSSCKKVDTLEEVPNCIKREIRKGQKDILSTVIKYNYKGDLIYEFHNSDISGSGYILDADCNLLCSTLNDSDNFLLCKEISDEASNGTIIWTKD